MENRDNCELEKQKLSSKDLKDALVNAKHQMEVEAMDSMALRAERMRNCLSIFMFPILFLRDMMLSEASSATTDSVPSGLSKQHHINKRRIAIVAKQSKVNPTDAADSKEATAGASQSPKDRVKGKGFFSRHIAVTEADQRFVFLCIWFSFYK